MEDDLIIDGLKLREASAFGGAARIAGLDGIPCALGTTGYGGRLVEGGFSPGAETTVTIRKAELQAREITPRIGMAITITDATGATRALKIAKEGIRDCIYAYEFTCDDLHQNA